MQIPYSAPGVARLSTFTRTKRAATADDAALVGGNYNQMSDDLPARGQLNASAGVDDPSTRFCCVFHRSASKCSARFLGVLLEPASTDSMMAFSLWKLCVITV